ncbi:MAG: diguanylate cyclase [Proteobacteria bacterium]|nr:diguanylate cyclase [Pseudomonadota bacterium]NOG61255.1 diguanylate cyclase [Pseudomonadota bacterium]
MLSNIKLRSLSIIITFILAIYACFSVLQSKYHEKELYDLENEWDYYRGYQSERVRLRAHLIGALGYGGLIHVYHNYIIRKTDTLERQSWKSYGYVKSIIEDLKRLSKSEGERASLEDISIFLDDISENLLTIKNGIDNNLTSSAIEKTVDNLDFIRVDRALIRLGEELLNQSPESISKKFNLSVKMRSLIGINGMIQSYKRYLLLEDENEYTATLNIIGEIKSTIREYLELDPELGERIAIEDIQYTIEKYEHNIDIIKEKTQKNLTAEEIDNIVIIDDSIALRGFELLESEKIEQIEKRATSVANLINYMEREQSIFTIIHFIFLTSLIVLFNFIIKFYVIKPVQNVSHALKRLSEGDLEVNISKKLYKDNEIGQLESAFEIFKQHEIERSMAEEKLRQLAMTDNLTGLANRVQLERRYSELVAIMKRKNEIIATFMMDLDNFKTINDTYGHAIGDKLLQSVSDILISELRETDIIARIGGDEFVLVLYAPKTESDVTLAAQRLIDKIMKIVPIHGSKNRIGASIGIVIESSNHSISIDDVLLRADKALYKAKELGKNKYVYHADVIKLEEKVRKAN